MNLFNTDGDVIHTKGATFDLIGYAKIFASEIDTEPAKPLPSDPPLSLPNMESVSLSNSLIFCFCVYERVFLYFSKFALKAPLTPLA